MELEKVDSLFCMGESEIIDSSNTNYKDLFYKAFYVNPILMAISTIEDGIFVDVNQAWLDTLGYSKEEVIGHSSQELNVFVDFQERQKVRQLIIENEIAREQEVRFITKHGDIRYGIFSGDIITLDNHNYLLTTAYDITDRIRIQQMEEKNRILEEQHKYDKLKSNFLANVSHELKTPVNIIFSSIQLLNIILSKDSSLEVKYGIDKQTKIMKQNCYRLIRLINNLVDITKVGSGYLKLNLDNCNVVDLIKKMTESVVDYGRCNGINIIFVSDFEEIITACDIEKVERIILNLLSNAIKFTPRDGSIYVIVHNNKTNVGITIRDTGVGIPKSKRKYLFRRFYQVNSFLTKAKEGSGIGLSLAKSLAELHNGDLYINEKYETGCEFILELPITKIKKSKTGSSMLNNDNNFVDRIKVEFSDIYIGM